jgi:phage repressor protein C with HTH and peptisase S24 domain
MLMKTETLSDRLNAAMEAAGHTQASLGEAVGMSQPSVWKLTTGKTKNTRKLFEISQVLGVRPEWLSTGIGQMRDDGQRPSPIALAPMGIYRVEVLDIDASAGPGIMVTSDFVETITAIEFTSEQAKALFGGRPSSQVKMITVNGDSMDDTLCSGDRVFVDMKVKSYDGDGIYVFVFDNNLHIKRLQMHKDRLLVLSDNNRYREWYIEESDLSRFYVMAKVLLGQTIDYKRFG